VFDPEKEKKLSAKRIGPVVPAIVAMVTDPSIPSNAPVPLFVVKIQFDSIKEGEREKKR